MVGGESPAPLKVIFKNDLQGGDHPLLHSRGGGYFGNRRPCLEVQPVPHELSTRLVAAVPSAWSQFQGWLTAVVRSWDLLPAAVMVVVLPYFVATSQPAAVSQLVSQR